MGRGRGALLLCVWSSGSGSDICYCSRLSLPTAPAPPDALSSCCDVFEDEAQTMPRAAKCAVCLPSHRAVLLVDILSCVPRSPLLRACLHVRRHLTCQMRLFHPNARRLQPARARGKDSRLGSTARLLQCSKMLNAADSSRPPLLIRRSWRRARMGEPVADGMASPLMCANKEE